MIVGILSLVFYNDPQVKEYFANLNGIPYPVAPEAPVPPAPPATPEPVSSPKGTPVIETETPAEVASQSPCSPEAEETPYPESSGKG